MAPEAEEQGTEDGPEDGTHNGTGNDTVKSGSGEEEDEDEEEEEPRLEYASLTKSLGAVYRNGDATSAFLVAGDKMIIGTHNGNIHVLSIPSFQSLRVYHAHSASITTISISPFPPPIPTGKPDAVSRIAGERLGTPNRSPSGTHPTTPSKSPRLPPVPATPSNSIHIGTSSIDGNVCVASLVDPKDVMLRSFGRPVQAVAMSPEFKNDRSYLSGGLAGSLILTVGGRAGTSSTSTTTGSAAAAASGWLGTIGLGSNTGKDTVLHSGEGTISTIKWSLSGKYVVWINEQGIKIMRSNLHIEADFDHSWKRISHIDRPNRSGWEEMAGVWKGRVEWVDEKGLESDEDKYAIPTGSSGVVSSTVPAAVQSMKIIKQSRSIEKLVVGWADTIWIINVHSTGSGVGKETGISKPGRAEIITILRTDCIISGITLYTPNLLLVLAYITPETNAEQASSSPQTTPKRGVHRRQNALQPEMRIININTKEEVCVADTLNVSRFESLSATDYHLGILPVVHSSMKTTSQRGTLEAIGGGLWDATMYPTRLFSSAASVRSTGSSNDQGSSQKAASGVASTNDLQASRAIQITHPSLLSLGMKIFIQSPYDCVLATKPTISDHFSWLDNHGMYEDAWNLLDKYPEAVGGLPERESSIGSMPSTPSKSQSTHADLTKAQSTLMDFFADDASQTATSADKEFNSQVEKEKRRIGERWMQQLVAANNWTKAGQVSGKVLGTTSSWEHWIWEFVHAGKFEEITPYIPTTQLQPPLPSLVYEVVLGQCISRDRLRFKELLERWPPELYDINSVILAIEGKLKERDVREDTVEDGQVGRDWRILISSLAKLYLADGRPRDALHCYIRLQDADAAMNLISEKHLVDAVSDDIPGLILLRISKEQQKTAPLSELEEASSEAIRLLVKEAHHGIVRPETVIAQLEKRNGMLPYLFFYIRALWNGDTTHERDASSPISSNDLAAFEGKSLVSSFADTALSLFAEYDRPLLMTFLKSSQSYTLETASTICEQRHYIPELVYLLSKEGRTKRALFLIIDELQDVSQAIAFAKEQDDPDLWNDLLDYSMNKPRFIRGLLEEVGTAINPITLVRRIPEGLEIEGLREGLSRMIKEYEIQDSISEGVARVLRGEVAMGMSTLRTGQKRGIKFEVASHDEKPERRGGGEANGVVKEHADEPRPGHCPVCTKAFVEDEAQPLIGFACSHVFHLSCLLSYNNPSSNEDAQTLDLAASNRGDDEGYESSYQTRSVGAKVTHARLLRDRVGDGCPLAVHKRDT